MNDAMKSYLYYVAMSCTRRGQSHLGCRSANVCCSHIGHGPGLVPFRLRLASWYMACTLGASPLGSH